jgi:selenoprotein W-related protein|tara:strand:+ start:221 stop:454 length:234 start_codon:yes stop_codon:yes gene_type:complete
MNISIEYSMESNYEIRALGLRNSLDSKFGILAEMRPSSGGVFEVTLNGSLIFSKKQLGRVPNDGEIVTFIEDLLKVI